MLSTWDKRTGDIDMSHRLKHVDYSQYDVQSMTKMGQTLLVSKENIQETSDEDFRLEKYFPIWRNKKNDSHQVTFL